MRYTAKSLLAAAFALSVVLAPPRPEAVLAQAQAPPSPGGPQTTFRSSTDLISTDVIVRDGKGQFVADLKATDFELFEDGVKQDIVSFALTHGGRTFVQQAAPTATPREGILVPKARPTNDASGRVFIVFIDDLHLDFRSTSRTRDIMKRTLKNLIHEGDMFGIVSTGTSSISQQLTYDRQVLEDAVERVTGGALRPDEVLKQSWGSQGPLEVRHRAHVTFETLNELLTNLEKVQNRRKAILYLSSGYDFNPYERTRFDETVERMNTTAEKLMYDPFQITSESQATLNEADLIGELTYVIKRANRANAAIYTIDPRGLVAGQDVDQEINSQDFQDNLRETQTSLRVLAEETGGFAIVNQNDFDKGLKRIDSETSDYYLLYFYSSNPDPLKRTRKLTISVKDRKDLQLDYRTDYSLRALARPPKK
jgi:VWFA-related protein